MPDPDRGCARARLRSFHELMQHRVQRILLISSLYDSFIVSEDGQLPETLLDQFLELDRGNIPDLVQVPDCEEALELMREDEGFDLVISSLKTSGRNAAHLVRDLRDEGIETPVVALAYSTHELQDFVASDESALLERVFLWQGDVRIFPSIVTYLEDRLNVANDTGLRGVPAIIVVEDNIRFYSSFLPTIHTEIFRHTNSLLSSTLNLSQKMIRMRARPKVLLCTSYEEAWSYFEKYGEYVLGVISDFEFPMNGELEEHAGAELCKRVEERRPDIRLVMQSSRPENQALASELGASFLLKGSPVLLQELRQLLVERFGFGDFIFRSPDGTEIDRAEDIRSFARKLAIVPVETVVSHFERGHFANWLKARTEFALAEKMRAREDGEPEDGEELRERLLAAIEAHRRERDETVIVNFDRKRFEPSVRVTRIGSGSLGGKGRGVAFANRMLFTCGIDEKFPEIDIFVPPAVVLATDVFDEFLAYERTHELALEAHSDEDIMRYFLQAPFPREAGSDLRVYLQRVKIPLAVRSSSLLEDSLSQPFAGVYHTYMLPNNDPELDVRLRQLTDAVKQVYASAFAEQAKTYLAMASHRIEEEKMAVMVQELVGVHRGDRFYPDFAGVARSHNFYPEPGHAAEDGVAAVALGMGKTVVGGDPCLRFCPKYPQQLVGFSSVRDALQNSQREFHALDLRYLEGGRGASAQVGRYPLEVAEEDGPLAWLGSTYSPEDDRVVDGISRPGVRLVSFAQVLKHGSFPLADLLCTLLERCVEGTGAPVEIEFAGNLASPGRRGQFAFLQLRPIATSKEGERVRIGDCDDADLICRTSRALGNAEISDVCDLVVVDAHTFQRTRSLEAAQDIARFDALLRKEGRAYILIGVGRWGSSDPNLGIPVAWNQIAGARVIVEAGFEDVRVAPSQGTHFFQNLTSCGVGYFSVNPELGEGFVDWDWLASLPSVRETELVRHVQLARPAVVKMDGRTGEGVVFKP